MVIDMGGIYNPVERENVERALKKELQPLIVVVRWRGRPETGKDNLGIVEGTTPEAFFAIRSRIATALAANACFYHQVVRREDMVLVAKPQQEKNATA